MLEAKAYLPREGGSCQVSTPAGEPITPPQEPSVEMPPPESVQADISEIDLDMDGLADDCLGAYVPSDPDTGAALAMRCSRLPPLLCLIILI